ncbi:MAG: Re/Si-specific NAD(P)(+) transhydrogenase subunit alpha [Gemmatimonadota bacterium]
MRVWVAAESTPRERRVALTPETAGKLAKNGAEVRVVSGAGTPAGFEDDDYRAAGVQVVDGFDDLAAGDVVLRVRPPGRIDGYDEVDELPDGAVLVGFLDPLAQPEVARRLADRGVTAYAMELIPRITRAQSMDALSSQANAAGYQAVLVAAELLPRFFPMLMTAAGTVPPAKVLVLGAGVAGLQAIATAKRLGAVVQGYDIRPVVKEQVESLGATYVGLEEEDAETEGGYAKEQTEEQKARAKEHLADLVAGAEVVVTTAAIPGRRAPVLIDRAMVERMHSGSVIVDVAAESGGNCELTRAGESVVHGGVTIVGLDDGASGMAADASRTYGRNLLTLLEHLEGEAGVGYDPEDEIAAACCVTHGGAIVNERVREAAGG